MEKLNVNAKQWSLATIEDEVKQQVKQFERERRQILDSDEPRLKVNGQRQWEINGLRYILDENVRELESKYNELGQQLIEEQEEKVRQETLLPTKETKEKVDAIVEEAIFYHMSSSNKHEKQAAMSTLSQRAETLNSEERTYLRRKLPTLQDIIKEDGMAVQASLTGLAQSLREIMTPEQHALEQLKDEVKGGPSLAYRQMQLAHESTDKLRKQFGTVGEQ